METCCQITQIKYNEKKMQQRKKSTDDENMNDLDIDYKRNQCNEPSKAQWTDRNESRRKRKISVYLNEMKDPIVLEAQLKSSKKFKISKSSEIFKNI